MKLRKLFLGTAVASLLVGTGAISANASTVGMTQNFDYVDGAVAADYNVKATIETQHTGIYCKPDNTSSQVAGKGTMVLAVVGTKDAPITTTSMQTLEIHNGENKIYDNAGEDMILKTSFYTANTFSKNVYLSFAEGDINAAAKDYNILAITSSKTEYNVAGGTNVAIPSFVFAKNTWYDLTVVLEENGDNQTEATKDVLSVYINGSKLYSTVLPETDNYTGKVNSFKFGIGGSKGANYQYTEKVWIDSFSTQAYSYSQATVSAEKSVCVGETFQEAPVFAGEAALSDYVVEISNTEALSYDASTKTFTGLAITSEPVVVTYNFVDENIADVTMNVSVTKGNEPILVDKLEQTAGLHQKTDTDLHATEKAIPVMVGQEIDLNGVFTASPVYADDTTVSFWTGNSDIVSLTNGVLKGLKPGYAKIKAYVPAEKTTAGQALNKYVTIFVYDGNSEVFGDYVIGDTWTKDDVAKKNGWEASEYTGQYARVFTNMEIVEDSIFGSALEFNGVGSGAATASGGAALIKHITKDELNADKDYKITGWAKVDAAAGVDCSNTRVDVKVYAYKLVNGQPSYLTAAPYTVQMTTLKFGSTVNKGWQYFEVGMVNNDVAEIDGFKVELITWNCQANTKSYVAGVSLVEQATVANYGWEAKVNGTVVKQDADMNWPTFDAKVNDTINLVTRAVPTNSVASNLEIASSNPEVVKVENGVVTAVATGTAVITITDEAGKSVEFTVVVKNAATSVTLESTNIELTEEDGYYGEFELVIEPAGATSTFTATASAECFTALIENNTLALFCEVAGTYTVTITCDENPEVSVVITVVVKEAYVEPEPSTPSTDVPTTEAPTTEAPTTQEPTTEAPTTQAPTTTEAPKTEKGCKGSVVSSVMAMVTLAGAVVLAKKRRK